MKNLYLFLVLSFACSVLHAEEGYLFKNRFYYKNKAYEIANLKGQNQTWDWEDRALRFSNSWGIPNDKQEYPESDEWIILGPFDLSVADNPLLNLVTKLEYGSNCLTVLASTDFLGIQPGSSEISGNWIELLTANQFNTGLNKTNTVSVDLSAVSGYKTVYIGIRYLTALTTNVSTVSVNEVSVTREIPQGVTEILPKRSITRNTEGIDFFNLPGTPGSTDKWSIRTDYAKASAGNDIWLVFQSFDLTSSSDAFFSFESKLLNGSNGPVGLELKVARSEFKSGDLIQDIAWEDYPNFGLDHRVNATDYYFSGKLDLSAFLGNIVSIAFRFINSEGEQYQIQNFQMFHLPDIEAPTINKLVQSKIAYNKIAVDFNATESGELYWGIFPQSLSGIPDFENVKTGNGSVAFGINKYNTYLEDTTFVFSEFEAQNNYKLVSYLMDGSANVSDPKVLEFTSSEIDNSPPKITEFLFKELNNFSLKVNIVFNESCDFYYTIKKSDEEKPSLTQIIDEGITDYFNESAVQLNLNNLERSVKYTLYISAMDFAGNQSEIFEYTATTSNEDVEPPVFEKLEVAEINNTGIRLTLVLDEVGNIFYAVQQLAEVPPTYEGIKSGGRAESFGTILYSTPGNEINIEAKDLKAGTAYVIYIFASDSKNNNSKIQTIEFESTSTQIPVLTKRSEERIIINRESNLVIDEQLYEVTGHSNPEEFDVLIFPGDNYLIEGQTIIAKDEFIGTITVPVALGKDTVVISNLITFDIIVDEQTVADSLIAVRRFMTGNHLISLPDKTTPVALLELRDDGSFFDAISSKSPNYNRYMTTVLGGRLINIAKDYHEEKFRRRKRIEVRHKMYKAIEYWLDHKPGYSIPESPFQWPDYLGAIMLVLHDDMDEEYETSEEYREQIDRLKFKVDEFNMWCWNGVTGNQLFQPFEGNNLTRRLWGTMAIAAALEQPARAFMVRDTLVSKLKLQYNSDLKQPAGLMPDGSFTMNNASGAQWNWITYGIDWANMVLEYAEFTRRTPWRLLPENFELLGNSTLNGASWLYWRDFVPYNLTSKYVTRRQPLKNKESIRELMNSVRYEAYLNNVSLTKNEDITNAHSNLGIEFSSYDSTKFFWNSNIMIHSKPNYFASLVMPSVRTGGLEAGKDSLYGLTNYFVGDGTLLTFTDELSYEERVFWDWSNLPGITAEKRDGNLPINYEGNYGKNKNQYAGGVSNGSEGVSSFYYDKTSNLANVNVQKSYFFFDEGIVALGSRLNKKYASKVNTVCTYIDQDIVGANIRYKEFDGDINSISQSVTSLSKSLDISNRMWVYTSGRGYVILPQEQGSKVNLKIREQKGAWDEINGTWRERIQQNPFWEMVYDSTAVFTLEIEHGKEPENAAYAYMIFPGISEKKFIEKNNNLPFKVIANTDSVQAVSDNKGNYGVVFIEGCQISLSEQLSVSADKSAIMLIKDKGNGVLEAFVSDPNQNQTLVQIIFKISNTSELPIEIQRIVSFPQGIYKGKAAYTSTQEVWDFIAPLPKKKAIIYSKQNELATSAIAFNNRKAANNLDVNVFPTPLSESRILNYSFNLNEPCKSMITLSDMAGRVLYNELKMRASGSYVNQINCDGFAPGVYLLKINAGNNSVSKKVIIK